MWNPFRAARDAAKAEREVLLSVLETQHEQSMNAIRSINETAAKMAEASKAQAESFTAYLNLFKVQSAPESRVMRDEDEYKEELRRSGFPVDASPEEQARWVLSQTE
jgi:hypothetical protein